MGREAPYPLIRILSLLNCTTKRTHRLKSTLFPPFKTNRRKCEFEYPIDGIINSGQIEGAYFGRVLSIFVSKKVQNDFSENKFL